MRKIITAALSAAIYLSAGNVAGADHLKPFPDPSVILVPPRQYDPRVQGIPKSYVYYIPHSRMYAVCSDNGTVANIGPRVLACAKRKVRKIYLPTGMSIALRNAVLRHERGHIWGWVHQNTTGGTENQPLEVLGLDEDDFIHHHGDHEK